MSYTCPTCGKGRDADHTACRISEEQAMADERTIELLKEILEEVRAIRKMMEARQ